MTPPAPRTRSHLAAFSTALLIAGFSLAVLLSHAQRLENRYVHALAPDFDNAKLQGVALQRVAFAQPDLLMIYGSSELGKVMENNPSEFFAEKPTGFTVFPVGKPGATSLTLAQKLAGVGGELRGRKVAVSLSPGWFFTEVFDPNYYQGNFSEIQASQLVYNSELSWALRRDLARRMIEYPRTLDNRPLLDFALHCLASNTRWDRLLFRLSWPLGKLNSALTLAQDHLEVALHIQEEDAKLSQILERNENEEAKPAHPPRRMDWSHVLKRAIRFANKKAVLAKRNEVVRRHLPRASRDFVFRQTIAKAKEWTDVELLLRTMKEFGAQPLLLSMPVEDIRLEVYGISPETRTAYNERLLALAERYQYPLIDFHEHQNDSSFCIDFLDHPSAAGWLFYNHALDDFYHDTLRPSY